MKRIADRITTLDRLNLSGWDMARLEDPDGLRRDALSNLKALDPHRLDITGVAVDGYKATRQIETNELSETLPWPSIWMEYSYAPKGERTQIAVLAEETEDGWAGAIFGVNAQGVAMAPAFKVTRGDGLVRPPGCVDWADPTTPPRWFTEPIANAIDAISILNCKNTSVEEIQVNPKVLKKRTKKAGGVAPLSFSRIVVHSGRVSRKSNGIKGERLGVVKHHVTRGSFATYTEEAKLFGKYTGTFWRPAHVKGDVGNGSVLSSHEVKV